MGESSGTGGAKDYQLNCIYKITCKDETITDCYVGHTVNYNLRKTSHKNKSKKISDKSYYNYKVYEFIRSNGGWDNFKMEIVEHYPCDTYDQAVIKEQEYITSLNATLNTFSAKHDKELYKVQRELQKPAKNAQAKERMKNPEIKEIKHAQEKAYRDSDAGKEKRAEWMAENIEKNEQYQKDYALKNKEKIKEKKAIGYATNKEAIGIARKILYTCSCGNEVQSCQKARHEKSAFHIKNSE